MTVRISSSGTFILKFLLPAIWIVFFLSFLIVNFDDVEFIKIIKVVAILILIGVIIYFFGFNLREVYYDKDEDMLIVKHLKNKIIISNFSIISIFETFFLLPKLVVIAYYDRYGHIKRFVFIPRTGFIWPFNNSYMNEMRQWINK